MGRPALLETFETGGKTRGADPVETDESWQAGFEAGYDKALQDMAAEQGRLTAQLVQCLNDQAFGYHEARTHLVDTLRPLFDELVGIFVPQLAQDTFVPMVTASLDDIASRLMDQPIELRVSPGLEPVIRSALTHVDDLPLRLVADDDLDSLQAILTSAGEEAVIDLRPVLQEVRSVLGAMTTTHMEYSEHG